ncbi:MAG: hypothetical protein ACT4QG_11175 [Sporichthyaceae bacterium]
MNYETTLHCADCAQERLFASVECTDGHHACPEYACTTCGAAVFVGIAPPAEVPSPIRLPDAA